MEGEELWGVDPDVVLDAPEDWNAVNERWLDAGIITTGPDWPQSLPSQDWIRNQLDDAEMLQALETLPQTTECSTMRVLGFESSCDETAVAVVEDGHRVLASVVQSQDELHETYGGVVPEIAGRAHAERIGTITDRALAEAGTSFAEIDAVAVAHRPGLIGSVLVGVAAAKSVAWRLGVPLIGVHHVEAALVVRTAGRILPALACIGTGRQRWAFEFVPGGRAFSVHGLGTNH